jgi:beta-ring hydroxylase
MPDYETLKRLDYAGACLKEALRLFNIVPIVTRKAVGDDRFGEYDVPAGCLVMLHLQALHKDPLQWPEPDAFRPERFLDESQSVGWRWLPFINGPRSCVGQHFSLLEAKIVLSLLAQRYDFTPAPAQQRRAPPLQRPGRPARQDLAARAPARAERRRRRVRKGLSLTGRSDERHAPRDTHAAASLPWQRR